MKFLFSQITCLFLLCIYICFSLDIQASELTTEEIKISEAQVIENLDEENTGFCMETDYRFMDGHRGCFIEDDFAYYQWGRDGFLYCSAKDELDWVPLCAKPECMHDDESCNAYIHALSGIGCHDGRIYYEAQKVDEIKGEIEEYCYLGAVNMDGSGHEEIRKLDYPYLFQCAYLIHRGYFYYVMYDQENDVSRVYKLDLDNPDQEMELILEEKGQCHAGNIAAYGEDVYFGAGHSNYTDWYHYQEEEYVLIDWMAEKQAVIYSDDNFIYYGGLRSKNICRHDRQDETLELLISLEEWIGENEKPMLSFDGEYIYCLLRNERKLIVWDMDGEIVTQAEVSCNISDSSSFHTSDRIYLFRDIGDTGAWYGYFEREEIRDGRAVFYEIEDRK